MESADPGTVSIDGGDYGRTPVDIPRLAPGRHQVVVNYVAGGSDTRRVVTRPGATTPVTFEARESRGLFARRKGVHIGLGAEGVFWVDSHGGPLVPGGRAFGRMSYATSPGVDLRVDLGIGAFFCKDYGYGATKFQYTSVPVTARFDAQFNFGTVYSIALGVDLGVNFLLLDATTTTKTGAQAVTVSTLDPRAQVGIHASLLTFRFGDDRQFMVSAQEGVLVNYGGDYPFGTFEQTFAFSWLFSHPRGGGAPPAQDPAKAE